MTTSIRRLCGLTFAMLFVTSTAAQDSSIPPMAPVCEACHGAGGVSAIDTVPTIAGMPGWLLADSMLAYGDSSRACTMPNSEAMCSMVSALSPEQAEELGQYYAGLTFKPAAQAFDVDKAAAGRAIHEAHCAKCHSDGGSNPDGEVSILAGQWMAYLRMQLQQYAARERPGLEAMLVKLENLSEDEREALVHYYASQQ